MLVEQRNEWRRAFEVGESPIMPMLDDYRKNRDSESWRFSSYLEKICEYVLYLEESNRYLHNELVKREQSNGTGKKRN